MRRPVRILYLENDIKWIKALSALLSDEIKYKVEVAQTVEEAIDRINVAYYHLLVIDINLTEIIGDEQGLTFLRDIVNTHPAPTVTEIIMLSGWGNLENMRRAFAHYEVADFFVKSEEFSGRDFIDRIDGMFRPGSTSGKFRINLDLEIKWRNRKQFDALATSTDNITEAVKYLKIGDRRINERDPLIPRLSLEFDDLMCRLFADATEITLEPITSGQSGAGVLRATPLYVDGRTQLGRAYVVKFGDRGLIEAEHKNFDKYVGKLPPAQHATRIEITAKTVMLGAVAYSLVGTSNTPFKDFGDLYRSPKKATLSDDEFNNKIISIINNLFEITCRGWYSGRGDLRSLDLASQYWKRLGIADKFTAIKEQIQGCAYVSEKELSFDDLPQQRFRNPLYGLRNANVTRYTYEVITHGDLNERNILIDETTLQTWLIDFAFTGYGHILRDFAELDVVIRLELLHGEEATLEERLLLENTLIGIEHFSEVETLPTTLSSNNPYLEKTYVAVRHIRNLAYQKVRETTNDDISEYYIALFFYSFSAIRFKTFSPMQRKHAILCSSLLSAFVR